jgi:hypothetical protein
VLRHLFHQKRCLNGLIENQSHDAPPPPSRTGNLPREPEDTRTQETMTATTTVANIERIFLFDDLKRNEVPS